MASHSDKARLRAVKMKLRMNKLPIIQEELSLIDERADSDKIFKLSKEITKLEKRKKADEE